VKNRLPVRRDGIHRARRHTPIGKLRIDGPRMPLGQPAVQLAHVPQRDPLLERDLAQLFTLLGRIRPRHEVQQLEAGRGAMTRDAAQRHVEPVQ
jgi:hypothetical protein